MWPSECSQGRDCMQLFFWFCFYITFSLLFDDALVDLLYSIGLKWAVLQWLWVVWATSMEIKASQSQPHTRSTPFLRIPIALYTWKFFEIWNLIAFVRCSLIVFVRVSGTKASYSRLCAKRCDTSASLSTIGSVEANFYQRLAPLWFLFSSIATDSHGWREHQRMMHLCIRCNAICTGRAMSVLRPVGQSVSMATR